MIVSGPRQAAQEEAESCARSCGERGEETPEREEAVPDQIGHGLETWSVEN